MSPRPEVDRVAGADFAGLLDRAVDAEVGVVVTCDRSQHGGVARDAKGVEVNDRTSLVAEVYAQS